MITGDKCNGHGHHCYKPPAMEYTTMLHEHRSYADNAKDTQYHEMSLLKEIDIQKKKQPIKNFLPLTLDINIRK